MNESLLSSARHLMSLAFQEDLGENGDITSRAIGQDNQCARADIIAKQHGVLCGIDVVPLAFDYLDVNIVISQHHDDGDVLSPGKIILELDGDADSILVAERTILNFLGRLSGVATLTRQFVDAVAGTKAKILDTRKTTPGWRILEKYAVKCGGGENHRIGLYDMFLIKENHIARAGGIAAAVENCRRYMEQKRFDYQIEVETQNLDDVRKAVDLSVDRIMLDNMTLQHMRDCVEYVAGRIPLEASGNVNLHSVAHIAETGVDYISVGALSHSPTVFDFSLLLQR